MKRHSNLPDFSKLCAPEQNSIQDAVSLLIHFFFLGSFWGFLWETLIFIAKDNTFRNRGFFYGPWLPVYGIGAAVFYCLFHSSRETISIRSLHKSNRLFLFKTKYHPLTIFIKTALLGTALELVIGWFLDIFFAGPLVRTIFGMIFKEKEEQVMKEESEFLEGGSVRN